jgi:hypothetical protein
VVRLYIASYNTAASTELTIRSALLWAGAPLRVRVGDSASQDGSREMLKALERQGLIELDISDQRVRHAEWLDRWIATCDDELAAFCDSDVEFLRSGWLARLLEAGRAADLVYTEALPGATDYVLPHSGELTRLAARPAPWLFMVRPEAARSVGVSFEEVTEPATGGALPTTYDVGGRFYHRALDLGLRIHFMTGDFTRCYRHFGGLSWGAYRRPSNQVARLVELRLARVQAESNGRRAEARRLAVASGTLELGWYIRRLPGRARPVRVAASLRRRVDARRSALQR